jgi:6-phosphogluconolactonase
MSVDLLIGGYGAPLTFLRFDPAADDWRLGEAIPGSDASSYGCRDEARGVLHFVEEREEGGLSSYRRGARGWERVAKVLSGGRLPCFVEPAPDGAALAIANYGDGAVTLYGLDPQTGLPTGEPAVQHEVGTGPDRERQEGPHAHCVRFHRGLLYSVDLGGDTVFARTYQAGPPRLGEPFVAFAAPPGEGPRQLAFHPRLPCAYLLSELGSHLFVLDVQDDGRLSERERHETTPAGEGHGSLGGHLLLNAAGDRLYVSNRGHDSIATFEAAADGGLTLAQVAPTGFASPRHMLLLEEHRRLVVVHEEGDSVAVIALGEAGGLGAVTQTVRIPKPAFVGRA